MVQEFGEHGSIPDIATRDFHGPNLERLLVDPYLYFAPDTAFGTAMLACIPLALTFCIDTCAIDEQVQWYCQTTLG